MIKKTFLGLATVMGLMGCNTSQEDAYVGDYSVKILPQITRVTGLSFDTNDQIGLTITQDGGDYIRNKKLTYSGSYFEADDLFWYPESDKTSVFAAYYPYSVSGVPTEFSVQSDQRSGCATSSLLASVKRDVLPSSSAVGMTFSRLCSSILIQIENQSGSPVTEVKAGGAVPTAMVDIFQKSIQVKPGVAPVDILALPHIAGTSYEVVTIPQTAVLSFTFQLQNGRSWTKTLVSSTLDPGMQYTLSVTITAEKVDISLSGDVTNWGDGGELNDGNAGGGGGSDSGTGILTYQGEQYRTVDIAGRTWMAENMRYIPNQALIGSGIWYPSKDGVECTDPACIKAQGLFYDFATATGGVTVGAGTPIQGICPAGWQLPDDALLQVLITDKSYNYNAFASFVGFWNENLKKYGAMTKSYLLGVSEASDGKRSCLLFVQGVSQPSMEGFISTNGALVRCVKVK